MKKYFKQNYKSLSNVNYKIIKHLSIIKDWIKFHKFFLYIKKLKEDEN